MKIVIRADASHTIGVGHFTRCLTLARQLNLAGHVVEFQSRCDIPELVHNAGEHGIIIAQITANNSGIVPGLVKSGAHLDWAILDGYHFTAPAYEAAREIANNLLIIDDVPRATEYPADIVLDQNYGAENHYYPVHSGRTLLGTKYALIRPEITSLREQSLSRLPQEITSIVVTFGGSDPAGATSQVVTALNDINAARSSGKLEVIVVAGPANTEIPLLENLCFNAGFVLHVNPPNLSEILATSDLAICGAGTTIWELMCLGIPILSLTIAENQIPASLALEQHNLIGYLGQSEQLSANDLASTIIEQLTDPDKLAQMASNATKHVDGAGPSRVITAMLNQTNASQHDGETSNGKSS